MRTATQLLGNVPMQLRLPRCPAFESMNHAIGLP